MLDSGCKAGSTRPVTVSDLNGVGRRLGEMEEDLAPLQVGPHLGAGLHALVLKPQLLHPNLTYKWWYSGSKRMDI